MLPVALARMSAVRLDAPIRYAKAGDVNIAYQVIGEGAVDVVYVPGLLNLIESSAEEPAIARHLERMAEFSRVVIFDKRGTGLSDRVSADEMADPERRVEDLSAVMVAARLERPVLFATADGTLIATRFTARHPERVRALVLYASTARVLIDRDYEVGLPAEALPPAAIWEERWGNDEDPMAVELVTPSMVADRRWRSALASIQRRAATPRAAYEYLQTTCADDVRPLLGRITVPTLVIHFAEDLLFPVAQGRYVAEGIPNAQYVELPDGEHFFVFQGGDAVIEEIEQFLTGARSPTRGGRRLATVVFTDIVGSTELAGRVGDARWRDLLESHDQLARRLLRRYGGEEVKFTGDGLLALFDAPDAAIDFTLAFGAGVRALGLETRASMHSGTVEMRGPDIAGMAVNVAARVLGHANASEVLLTRTVKDLVAGSGALFTPRGQHHLKGVPDRWELYAVEASG
jgi:pimeloyl-ACP methyl ester carboxylesterase/class 3 adenylate cyclase